MKVRIEKSELLDAVAWVSKALTKEDSRPALKFLRLLPNPHNGIMTVHVTDLEIHAIAEVPYHECDEGGEALVPAEKFLAVLRNLPDCLVKIVADSKGVSVIAIDKGMEYELPTTDTEGFPKIPETEREWQIKVEDFGLRKLASATLPSVAVGGARYAMTGLRMESENGLLRGVATDGRRLTVREVSATGEGKGGCIAPHRAGSLMVSVPLADSHVYWDANSLDIRWGESRNQFRIVSRLIEGKFPNWQAVIPKEKPATQFKIAGAEFIQAIGQAAVTAEKEEPRLGLITQAGKVLLQAAGVGVGASRVYMPAELVEPGIVIHVNPSYLAQALKPAPSDVLVSLYSESKPIILKSTEDGTYTCLVMPLT